MESYLVTDGQVGAVLLADLLIPPFTREQLKIVAGKGESDALSMARTLLASRPSRVG